MLKRLSLILILVLIFFEISFPQCTNRDQEQIEAEHIKMAVKMFQLFDKKISETEFENRVSKILGQMYENYCKNKPLKFYGKIGNLSLENNGTDLYVRIDNKISNDKLTLLINYQTTLSLEDEIASKLNEHYKKGEFVIFSFDIGNFFSPITRSNITNRIKNGTAGSFPMDQMWEGVNPTISDDVDYVFPVMIDLRKVDKLADLFKDESGTRDIKILNNKIEYYISEEKGKKLAELTSTRTLEHFGKYKSYALYYDESHLKEFSFYDIIFTLLLRNLFATQELLDATNKDIFAEQYFRLNSSLSSSDEIEIQDVKIIANNKATAKLYVNKKEQTGDIYYVKEEQEWKIDFYPLFMSLKKELDKVGNEAKQKGYTIKEFSLFLLNQQFPNVKKNIWYPMNR